MNKETRALFNNYCARVAAANNLTDVADTHRRFNVEPAVEQKMMAKVQEESNFLQHINIEQVDQIKGEILGLGVNSPVANRNNTKSSETRRTRGRSYELFQTDFNIHFTYQILDTWRHRPSFQRLLQQQIAKQIARDLLIMGFNGTSAAKTTDRSSNPLLQDVNIGWLQKLRSEKSSAVMSGKKIGDQTGADYKNIDAAVFDAVNELIAPWNQDDTGLVVILGRKLLNDKYFALLNNFEQPTERKALDLLISNKTIGTLPVVRVPFFPDNAVLITRPDNLSIYTERGATRRAIIDRPEADCITDYHSINMCYTIEDLDAACLLEGILTPDGSNGWA